MPRGIRNDDGANTQAMGSDTSMLGSRAGGELVAPPAYSRFIEAGIIEGGKPKIYLPSDHPHRPRYILVRPSAETLAQYTLATSQSRYDLGVRAVSTCQWNVLVDGREEGFEIADRGFCVQRLICTGPNVAGIFLGTNRTGTMLAFIQSQLSTSAHFAANPVAS
jgi:hypothetical protein